MRTAIVMLLAAIALVACRDGSQSRGTAASPDSPYVKIWVSKNGTVEVDGKPTELNAVGQTLEMLAQKKGVVLYGRDDASEEPHPNATQVIQMVISNGLPIRLCTKPDFSDAVGPDGKLRAE